ncbi:MAG TPA: PDZ domain-containing protein [Dokdonella sp.]|nr:PDZ domain-containing protein [Dokdonella sp.]
MPIRHMCRFAALALALSALTPCAQAQQTTTTPAVEQQLRESLRVLLLDMVQAGAFGDTPAEQLELSIDSPRQRVGDLGLIVDSTAAPRAGEGLRVLGTTPGGNGERIGLRAGDVIIAVNGLGLGSGPDAAARLREAVGDFSDGAAVEFDLRRDGRPTKAAGTLTGTWLPAMRLSVGAHALASSVDSRSDRGVGCGRIVIFDTAPRQDGLHAATLNRIDGRTAGITGQTSFRLPVGRHELEIGERIDPRYLSFNDRLRNAGGVRYKTLVIDVGADTEYHVAVRLNQDRRNEWKDGAFWDPVVWREAAQPCR